MTIDHALLVTELAYALNLTADLTLRMDTKGPDGEIVSSKAYYTDEMILDASVILTSVLSNRAIQDGHIKTEQEAKAAGEAYHQVLLDYYGFDTYKAKQILENNGQGKQ